MIQSWKYTESRSVIFNAQTSTINMEISIFSSKKFMNKFPMRYMKRRNYHLSLILNIRAIFLDNAKDWFHLNHSARKLTLSCLISENIDQLEQLVSKRWSINDSEMKNLMEGPEEPQADSKGSYNTAHTVKSLY